MESHVNVEETLEELRKRAEERRYEQEPLEFQSVTISDSAIVEEGSYSYLKYEKALDYLKQNWHHEMNFPITGANKIVLLVKKMFQKCIRFMVYPIVDFQNAYNANNVRCLLQMEKYLEEAEGYRQKIEELEKKVEELERGNNRV